MGNKSSYGFVRILVCFAISFASAISFAGRPSAPNKKTFYDNVVFLEAPDQKIMSDAELQQSIEMLNKILASMGAGELITRGYFTNNFYDYFNEFEDIFNSQPNEKNLLTIPEEKLDKRFREFSDAEIKYANSGANQDRVVSELKLKKIYRDSNQKLKVMAGNSVVRKRPKWERMFSYRYINWMLYLDKTLEPPVRNIYITNTLILDDADDAPIHSLIRGGLVNGICNDKSFSLIVSYFPLVNESELFKNRTPEFKSRRPEILAHILAHEIGHCSMNMPDDYTHPDSEMFPIYMFDYLENISLKKINNK